MTQSIAILRFLAQHLADAVALFSSEVAVSKAQKYNEDCVLRLKELER